MKYFLLIVVCIFSLPDFVQAQTLGLTEALCDGPTCSACHLVELGNRLIKWLIGIVVILFAVLAVWAGFGLVTSGGNPSALQDAKSRFTNAFIGLLIVLSAWLLVDTLMRGIVNGADGEIAGYGPWSEVQCATQSVATTNPRSLEIGTIDMEIVESFTSDHGDYSTSVGTSTGPIVGGTQRCVDETESLVVSVPGESGHRLLPSAANNYVAMRTAAAADGINLSIRSSYRSDATQVEIWSRRGCTTSSCRGRVAQPCSLGGNGSNHSSGVAIDINGSSCGSAMYNWLKANGGRFGFYNNLPCNTDPVHWSPSGR